MMIPDAQQTRNWDAYTIAHEPIASIDLMERAARAFSSWFQHHFPDIDRPIYIFCGPGNNGGDGLAVARMLHQQFFSVTVYLCYTDGNTSADFRANLERLPRLQELQIFELQSLDPLPAIPQNAVVIDALFGSGLNRALQGDFEQLILHLNAHAKTVVSIDIPSGLFADRHTEGTSIHAHHTLSFETPKLAFLFPENADRVGEWSVQSIGLHPDFGATLAVSNHYIDLKLIRSFIRKRKKYDHKGNYGHALLIAGSFGKAGAAILSARACLRSGAGLLTVHVPRCAYEVLQATVPEAMVSPDWHQYFFSKLPESLEAFQAIGIGCGLDRQGETATALLQLLETWNKPMVLDADALNLLSEHPDWYIKIPQNSILTPHPKEFERLFGKSENDFERNALQRRKAQELKVYILLKGAHSCIATPDGLCYFNSTGNPGMATGGSGDVLTGILTGLLAQGYSSLESALLGVYLHGLAGDLAAAANSAEALIAGDLVAKMGEGFQILYARD
ncbi:MAG: NAD(P)H-hydrate dehydratase [Saprospiraceae bacterium]|nr:NAD(P)H-hydrate dehydratase [Saprospiraceae bacterium]